MQISEAGIAFIAQFEGFSPVAYDDPAGNCTLGYGELLHLGPCTDADRTVTLSEAEGLERLRTKAEPYGDAVARTTRPLNQNEFDALSSLCYNIGPGGYLNSSVRTAVNSGGDVCAALRQIVHGSDGVVYPGLVRRREAECELFNTPEEHMASAEYDELKVTTDAIKQTLLEGAIATNAKLDALQTATDYLIKVVTNLAPRVAALEK